MMTCRELIDQLVDLVAGELPPERHAAAEQHLQCCPPCQVYAETYRLTVRLCRRLPCCSPPPHLMQRLHAALDRPGDRAEA